MVARIEKISDDRISLQVGAELRFTVAYRVDPACPLLAVGDLVEFRFQSGEPGTIAEILNRLQVSPNSIPSAGAGV
jgi:hypothetical protein